MDSSPAQRLMSRRLKTSLPVTNKLLEPSVVTGVVERLQHRKQQAKSYYDRSACDLPDLNIGEKIHMQPLPQKNPALWRVGACLQKTKHEKVYLRVAESTATQALDTSEPEMPLMPESSVAGALADSPDLVKISPSDGHTYTRAGRLSKPPKRLDL
ncbi:thrombospondin type-1 domain-containing protein 7A-like [Tachysurus ichikawai]